MQYAPGRPDVGVEMDEDDGVFVGIWLWSATWTHSRVKVFWVCAVAIAYDSNNNDCRV
jgi:hypothetical protein